MSWSGYCWTLAECEARELANNGESREFSLWSMRKKNRKVDKWGGEEEGDRREDLRRE